MGDYFVNYFSRRMRVPNSPDVVERTRTWMVDEGLILPGVSADPVLGSAGHRAGPAAAAAMEEPYEGIHRLRTNGVEIIGGPHVFYVTHDLGPVSCPVCGLVLSQEIWLDPVTPWLEDRGDGLIACPSCSNKTEVGSLNGMEWGFSNFGLTFWNWSRLAPQILEELQEVCGLALDSNESKL